MALVVCLSGRSGLEADGVAVADAGLGQLGRVAMAFLVAERHRPVDRHELAEVLWGERLPATWESALRTHLTNLRRLLRDNGLPTDVLVARRGCYQLHLPDGVVVDVEAAEGALERARASLAAGVPDAARRQAASSASVAAQQFLPGASGAWVEQRRAEVRRLRVAALEVLAQAATRAGDWATAVEAAEEAVGLEPLRESAYVRLMAAHAAAGSRGDALRAYGRCRQVLAEELGVDPSEVTEAAYVTLLGKERDALPEGVVTFCLTDIERSTLSSEPHPTAMVAALERHGGLVAAVIEAHGGRFLNSGGEGDATLSVFAKASDAAAAAVALQQAVDAETWGGGLQLRIRVALHTGEAELCDGAYFGATLKRAAELRALAAGGQVLCSRATAALVADKLPVGTTLSNNRIRASNGLDLSEGLIELVAVGSGPGAVVSGRQSIPFGVGVPARLAGPEAFHFVRRTAERQLLDEAWAGAGAGTTQLVLVGGEPGAGKTRLAAEVARDAHRAGAAVLWGSSIDGLAVPFQPFVHALHQVLEHLDGPELLGALGPGAGELVRLVPGLAQRLPGLSAPLRADPELEQFRLFEAVAGWLGALGRDRPVLLVLDDLQWATPQTLMLVRHLLQVERAEPLALAMIATYRDTEIDRHHPLGALLGELGKLSGLSRVIVSGLDPSGVGSLAAEVADRPLDDDGRALAEVVHRETGGNPLFAGELIRHLDECGRLQSGDGGWSAYGGVPDVGVPDGISQVVRRRVDRLSDLACSALRTASVIGAEFGLDLLAAVTDVEHDQLLDALEEALGAKLVNERDRPGSFSFSHAIVQASLADGLTRSRRSRLHLRIGAAIEALHHGDLVDHLPALAHHHIAASPLGDPIKAATYALEAGFQAVDRLAFEDAGALFRRGLSIVEDVGDPAATLECELFLALADATKNFAETRSAAKRAAELARRLENPVYLAQAAAAHSESGVAGAPDPTYLGLCEEALAALRPEHHALRSLVLASLATFRSIDEGRGEAADDTASAAVESARLAQASRTVSGPNERMMLRHLRRPVQAVLANALIARSATLMSSTRSGDRLEIINELELLQRGSGTSFDVLRYRAPLLLELGDADGFRADVREMGRQFADRSQLPLPQALWHLWQGMLANVEGRFDDVDEHAQRVLSHGLTTGDPNLLSSYAGQLFTLHRERGELADLTDLLHDAAVQSPRLVIVRAMLALSLLERGETGEAAEHLSVLAIDDFSGVSRDSTWTASLAYLAEVATGVDARDHAAALYRLFLPHAGHLVVLSWGVACLGAVDRFLGMLASTCAWDDQAMAHFETAMTIEATIGAPPLLARTSYWSARTLLARSSRGDGERAEELLTGARSTAGTLGMKLLEAQAGERLALDPSHP